jgi:transcriptional regulator with XRE-family HTH domain
MKKVIAERLLEERLRLKLKKGEMAGAGGVANSTYTNYEEGTRSPDGEFLAGIAAAGADVLYILTGIRALVQLIPREVVSDKPTHLQSVETPKRRITDKEDMVERRAEKMAQLMAQLSEEQQKEMFFIIEKECEFNQLKSQVQELQQRVLSA